MSKRKDVSEPQKFDFKPDVKENASFMDTVAAEPAKPEPAAQEQIPLPDLPAPPIKPDLPDSTFLIKPDLPDSNFLIRARVEEIIKNRSFLAAGLGIVPVPVFNLISVSAVQLMMVQSITRLYNVEVKKSWVKNVIASVLGGLGTAGLSGLAAGTLGAVPIIGTSLAVLSPPALNGLSTYAIGYMFVRYFESGDGFLKTNIHALGEWFREGFREGREKLGGAIAGNAPAV